jgi:hypothetical protein
MIPSKKSILALLGGAALMLGACSGVKQAITTGGGGGAGGGGGPFIISGTIISLTGTGLILQNNGADTITIKGTGQSVAFAFPTAVTGKYSVTVVQNPSNPAQTCGVTNGSGTASANVINVVVACGTVVTIGGTVTGLSGTGLTLQDNGGDTITITGSGNVPFQFPTPLPTGSTYTVTILKQPVLPKQTCMLSNATGTANGVINNVQILCPQPTFTIGGTLIGLVNGPGDTSELLNNSGDNIFVTGNDTVFTFPTQVTANGAYNVSIFVDPTSQPQPCWIFFYTGIATSDVTSVLVDCQHNDWTWRSGPNSAGNNGAAALPPSNPDKNTPGGRDYAAAWTDTSGRHWLFGGYGEELAGKHPPDLPGLLNDLWVFNEVTGGWIPANAPITTVDAAGFVVSYPTPTVCGLCSSSGDLTAFESVNLAGVTGGAPGSGPGGRWGSVTWSDSAGNLWLFGGQGITTVTAGGAGVGLLNDVWEWTPGAVDVSQPASKYGGSYIEQGSWAGIKNVGTANNPGTYGNLGVSSGGFPGGRWGAGFATDAAGNVWMFGGQGFDSTGSLTLLNDLWKYNIVGQTWTWMGPTNSNVGQNNGVYGTQGTALAANAPGPGGRQTPVIWADNLGNIWLFGGLGLDSVGTRNPGSLNGLGNGTVTAEGALLNDLWEFNIASGQWTWVSGGGATGLANLNGVYGTQLTGAAGNFPGSRWSGAGWSDSSGNLWLFGGWGYASTLAQSTGFLNDVWEYVPALGQWVWWKGSNNVNQNGSYKTPNDPNNYNIPYTNNTPGGRRGMAFWPQDNLEYVWVFGGQGFDSTSTTNGYLNDFWTYLGYPKYPNQ